MAADGIVHVQKACAYITRDENEILVFNGPRHEGIQVPKGTIKPDETPQTAVCREIIEESGLASFTTPQHLVTDVWQRRRDPPKRYVRHFFHATVATERDSWTHTVTGDGPECGREFEFSWIELPAVDASFALDLDVYVDLLYEEHKEYATTEAVDN